MDMLLVESGEWGDFLVQGPKVQSPKSSNILSFRFSFSILSTEGSESTEIEIIV